MLRRVSLEVEPDSDQKQSLAARLPAWAERLTRLLDDAIRIPGTNIRFGLDGLLGALLPGAGDALTALSSVSLLALALQRRVPRVVLLRMLLNVTIDTMLGSIPLVGDLFDVAFKSNRRNLELIRFYVDRAERQPKFSDYLVVALALVLVALGLVLPILVAMLVASWIKGHI
jgi:hypothetical protein